MTKPNAPAGEKTRKFVDLQFGERLVLDDGRTVITLESKTGRRARLRVETVPSIPIEKDHEPTPA